MVVQIAQMKSQMEAEILSLNESNVFQNQKLIEEKQREGANVREIQRLKNEQLLLQQKYDDLNREYYTFKVNIYYFSKDFKERAQYVLQQQSLEENEVVSIKSNSAEIQDLIENLELKNEKISKLT